jgi:hypothetical protein
MACVLEDDASGKYDFVTKSGSTATIKVTATGGQARFIGARLNTADVPILGGDTVQMTFVAGINIAKFVIAVSDPNDTIQLLELCEGGATQVLEQYKNDPTDPVTGFSVFGF